MRVLLRRRERFDGLRRSLVKVNSCYYTQRVTPLQGGPGLKEFIAGSSPSHPLKENEGEDSRVPYLSPEDLSGHNRKGE